MAPRRDIWHSRGRLVMAPEGRFGTPERVYSTRQRADYDRRGTHFGCLPSDLLLLHGNSIF